MWGRDGILHCGRQPRGGLAAAHELNDLYFGVGRYSGGGPEFTLDDRPIQFDRHSLRLQVERTDHVEQCRLVRKAASFAVDGNPVFG